MKGLRILVTGSRRWRNREAIALAISDWLESRGTTVGGAYPIPTVVHGCQRTWDPELRDWYGADWLAGCVARNWGYGEDRRPADWDRYDKKAGVIRNQAMVDLGADVCLAFPLGESRGTRHCMGRAEAAGIRVINCGDPS